MHPVELMKSLLRSATAGISWTREWCNFDSCPAESCALNALYSACCSFVSVALSPATAVWQPSGRKLKRFAYGEHDRHYFKIWYPKGEGPFPVLVNYHGGAFLFGGPNGGKLKGAMLKNGVAVVGATYRFRQHGASKREIMEDGARVIQYLRANADELCIDPVLIGVSGYSAGGVIASWVALHDDIADPDNTDPILRESSRVFGCCLDRTQVHPIHIEDWVNYTGGDPALIIKNVLSYILVKLDGSVFRNPIIRSDYASEEEYQAALDAYERDVFTFYLVSLDDPPVCFVTNARFDPARYIRKNKGGGLHSPLLMMPMANHLVEDGVPMLWDRKKPCEQFMLNALLVP